jgi:hypothetical protein
MPSGHEPHPRPRERGRGTQSHGIFGRERSEFPDALKGTLGTADDNPKDERTSEKARLRLRSFVLGIRFGLRASDFVL